MAALQSRNLSKVLFMENTPLISFIRKYEKLIKLSEYEILTKQLQPYQKKYLPGPYPRTEEEWIAAAEKYNMHIDEYKAYAPEKGSLVDYPNLPLISAEAKDPYYPWDHIGPKTCYGETLSKHFHLLQGDRCNYGVRQPISDLKGAAIYIGFVIVYFLIDHFSIRCSQPRLAKQYPGKGVHYTFELK
ncbi:NADH dehydrogenase [ubiquinone] 1 beta subcomplex subunit 8, mitochondrial [Bombus affinis]|uniref:NADH dehydrogenase [ubiquinone] 1 beta subcomplex subunit 8, mitochondrial n=1 Tax=Bombus affinis TaxID=309941 RepID=UPI0021B7F88B|nr:NADH dehydrogenase [ubiquinone] 1 beta subcomplex subunit 8, mitochondrial [Bombus affinis]